MSPYQSRILECLGLLALLCATACELDECRQDAHECDGNVAVNCGYAYSGSEQLVISESPCASDERCIDAKEHAFCAQPDTSLDAECDGTDQYDRLCSGNATLSCQEGYATSVHECDAGYECVDDYSGVRCKALVEPEPSEPPCHPDCVGGVRHRCAAYGAEELVEDCEAFCVVTDTDAFCSQGSVPDARCVLPEGTFCDGNAYVQCHEGYVTTESDCGASVCVNANGTATCALNADPDPLCADRGSHCNGEKIVFCQDGYATAELECAGDGVCVDLEDAPLSTCR